MKKWTIPAIVTVLLVLCLGVQCTPHKVKETYTTTPTYEIVDSGVKCVDEYGYEEGLVRAYVILKNTTYDLMDYQGCYVVEFHYVYRVGDVFHDEDDSRRRCMYPGETEVFSGVRLWRPQELVSWDYKVIPETLRYEY